MPRGRVLSCSLTGTHAPDYYVYVPPTAPERPRALVCVHGTSRNAIEHALLFMDAAERLGMALLAPLFRRRRHRGYQRIERRADTQVADEFFDAILADAAKRAGIDTAAVTLFGFSGGAQFAHRYALTRPERVSALVVAAAGWYTLPTLNAPYPLGVLPNAEERFRHVQPRLDAFLRIPTVVTVGTEDTQQDPMLNTSEPIVSLQGPHRLARAHAWFESLRAESGKRGLEARHQLVLLDGIGHSFGQAMRRSDLGQVVERAMRSAQIGPRRASC